MPTNNHIIATQALGSCISTDTDRIPMTADPPVSTVITTPQLPAPNPHDLSYSAPLLAYPAHVHVDPAVTYNETASQLPTTAFPLHSNVSTTTVNPALCSASSPDVVQSCTNDANILYPPAVSVMPRTALSPTLQFHAMNDSVSLPPSPIPTAAALHDTNKSTLLNIEEFPAASSQSSPLTIITNELMSPTVDINVGDISLSTRSDLPAAASHEVNSTAVPSMLWLFILVKLFCKDESR